MVNKEPPYIFQTSNHFGRSIKCSEVQWVDHVCDPADGREYLLDSEEDLLEFIQTIEKSDGVNGILVDRDYPNRLIYMRKSERSNYYNRVVVEFDDSTYTSDGFVVTAYQPVNVRDGDKPLWNN